MSTKNAIVVKPRPGHSLVGTVRHVVGALLSRKERIDADYESACTELAAWTAARHAELDAVEGRLREREEAIDVEILNEARVDQPPAAPDPSVAQLLARARALVEEDGSASSAGAAVPPARVGNCNPCIRRAERSGPGCPVF